MTSSAASLITQALEAAITGGDGLAYELFTHDVMGWSPHLEIASLAELEVEFAERDDVLSNAHITVDRVEQSPGKVIAEWHIAADHTGPFLIADELLVEPTGRHIVLAGATFAELRGDQICAFRHYYDDTALLKQLVVEPGGKT
jgi:hypothetical protein